MVNDDQPFAPTPDQRLVEALARDPRDERHRESARKVFRETLLGALLRLDRDGALEHLCPDRDGTGPATPARVGDEVLHTVTEVAVEELLDRFLLGGRWRPTEGTVREIVVACGLEVLAEHLVIRAGGGHVSLGDLLADRPGTGTVAAVAGLVEETGPTSMAVALLVAGGEDPAGIARSLGVPAETVSGATERFWTRYRRLVPPRASEQLV